MPDYYIQDHSQTQSGVNMLEIILVSLVIAGIVISGILGFLSKNNDNRDIRRDTQINIVIKALGLFYGDSSRIPNDRRYPISRCSGQLNEVDYEYTLKKTLTGNEPKINNFSYITEANFPIDEGGITVANVADSRISKRGCDKSFGGFDPKKNKIYNNEWNGCEFSREKTDEYKLQFWESKNKFLQCFLYSSDDRGFEYSLAYFSEADNNFVIYSQKLNGTLTKKTSPR